MPASAEPPCDVIPVEVGTGQIRTRRTDTPIGVKGGVWLTDESSLCLAKKLARLEAENRVYRDAPVFAPPTVIVGTAVAFTLGVIAGVAVWRAASR